MAARIEIKGWNRLQKKIADDAALDGVIETKIEKARTSHTILPTEKKDRAGYPSTGTTIKLRPQILKARSQLAAVERSRSQPSRNSSSTQSRLDLSKTERIVSDLSRKTKLTSLPSANATGARVLARSELLPRAKQPPQPQEESGCGSGSSAHTRRA